MQSAKGLRKNRRGKSVHDQVLAACESLLLDQIPPEQVSLADVLKLANVARATVYHHFGDLEGLVGTAILSVYARNVRGDIEAMADVLHSAPDAESLGIALRAVTRISQSDERKRSRSLRASFICYAHGRPKLATDLASLQSELTGDMTIVISSAQQRGFLRSDISPHAMAVFLQAYSLGKVVDDIAAHHLAPGSWEDLIDKLVSELFIRAK